MIIINNELLEMPSRFSPQLYHTVNINIGRCIDTWIPTHTPEALERFLVDG